MTKPRLPCVLKDTPMAMPSAMEWKVMAARMRSAFLASAPRKWWNRVDDDLVRSLGGTPTRADRCCYVFYAPSGTKGDKFTVTKSASALKNATETLESAMEYLTDPVVGSPSLGKCVC